MSHISPYRLGLAALAAVGLLCASSAYSALRPAPQSLSAPGTSHLMAFGNRGPAQALGPTGSKLDGALADLARHAGRVRPGHVLEDLHALNPAVRFSQAAETAEPLVLIDAVTRGDGERLKAALVALGLQHASLYRNDVSGWLPVRQIMAATARAELHSLRAAMSRTRVGAVTSQGDFVQGSGALRTTFPTLTGAGVKVGILSDSYNCYNVYAQPGSGVPASAANGSGYAQNGFLADAAKDMSTGDLPASVQVLEEAGQGTTAGTCLDFGKPLLLPYGDEGRAIMQIVHDVAPGAGLAFHTAVEGEADFANGIKALAAAGAKVIVDDVGYFDEPFFQDSLVGEAIDTVAAQGVAYFSSAGNNGRLAYDNLAPNFNTTSTTAPNSGEKLLNFDTSNATTTFKLPLTIGGLFPGEFLAVVIEWDQPFVTGAPGSGGATSQIDLCVVNVSGNDEILNVNTGLPVVCTGSNALGADPVQILIIGNPANASGNTTIEHLSLEIGVANGTPMPGRVKVAVESNGGPATIDSFFSPSPTLQGHPAAIGAAAVGAANFQSTPACGVSPATIETFSSMGGDPTFFDSTGTRLAVPVTRQKPDFVAPDGVNDTFLGFTVNPSGSGECQNGPTFPSFYGTSAAAPHAAAVAALMLQSNPSATPSEILADLRTSALPMSVTPPDFRSGYGFIQADAAIALMAPGVAPAVSVAPASITVGASATVTWSSMNTTGCTATGSWSGMLASNGSMQVTPAAVGTYTYTLVCANGHGSTPSGSAMLTVTNAPTFTAPGSLTASAASSTQINLAWGAATETGGTISQYRIERCQGSGCSSFTQVGTATTLAFNDTGLAASTAYSYRVRAADAQGNTGPYSSVASATTSAAPPPPSGGGGGGGLDGMLILTLAGLACTQRLRDARGRDRRSTWPGAAR